MNKKCPNSFPTKPLTHLEGILSRRKFLSVAATAAAAAMFPRSLYACSHDAARPERSLVFYNTHTGEHLSAVYWLEGSYVPESLTEVNHILRDHLTNEVKNIDKRLLDLLFSIRTRLETRQPFHVISGYRSPETNALLRRHSSGVAKNSLHIIGKAIDIRIPGRALPTVRRVALDLKGGGVGYYPQSDFVHVDVGRVRFW
jgi:uncharacterized protein YcbK (DUF882 family)